MPTSTHNAVMLTPSGSRYCVLAEQLIDDEVANRIISFHKTRAEAMEVKKAHEESVKYKARVSVFEYDYFPDLDAIYNYLLLQMLNDFVEKF